MALTTTSLSAACSASDLTLAITSTSSGFPAVGTYASPSQVLQVDGEKMLIQVVPVSGTVKVMQRGYDRTAAAAHDILAPVYTSSNPQDFAAVATGLDSLRPTGSSQLLSIGEDLTFTAAGTAPVTGTSLPIPSKDTTYFVTKATAAAITLISATSAQAGLTLTFVNAAAVANVITYTPGFLGDTTSSDLATSAQKVGASFSIKCGPSGLWAPLNTGTGTGWTLG
tara:strand:+ start:1320 stop:1994 length:675 start_codon:yes stop_codon:yes gene_type:complete